MSTLEKTVAELTVELLDLEEFLKLYGNSTADTCIESDNVVIAYKIKGQRKYFALNRVEIQRMFQDHVKKMRKELSGYKLRPKI